MSELDKIYKEIGELREARAKVPLDSSEYKRLTAQMTELYNQIQSYFAGAT